MLLASLICVAFAVNAQSLPPGESKALVQQHCEGCHAMKVVTSKRASRKQWSNIVDQMVTRGAEIPDDDIPGVVDYLAKNFGPLPSRTAPVYVNTATADELSAALELSSKESASVVSYREQNGNFTDWKDLTKVPGIDAKKIEANKDRIVF
jgi:competence ComEA-like helix-hairpin-helix protein